jgi:hypothetical protein
MEGDWVVMEGNRISLVMTAKEALDGGTELYRYFDADWNLLYVGISFSSLVRLAQHRSTDVWFQRVTRIEIERFDRREEAEEAERKAIRRERPEFNSAFALHDDGEGRG